MTNKAQHTPGPWQVVKGNNLYIADANDCVVCELYNDMYTKQANARLIAAAPVSHEANIAALEYLCDTNPRGDRRYEVIRMLEAAIAKTKGE